MTYILIFFLSLISAISFTPQLIKFLVRGGVIDYPDERKVHHTLIPRMGGLVPLVIFLVLLFVFHTDLNSIRLFIIGFLVITGVGIYDDVAHLKWYFKFVGQVASVVVLVFFLSPFIMQIQFFEVVLPPVIGELVLGFFLVGAINAVNLMDGVDGLVSGYALLVILTVIGLLTIHFDPLIALTSFAVAGALLGYLKYNANPAQIFLGDTGSYFLGFILVFLTSKTALNFGNGKLDLAVPILLLAVPILDTLKVMAVRYYNKKSMFLPDKTHLHHRLLLIFGEQKVTVFFILGFSTAFLITAVLYLLHFYALAFILFAVLVVTFIFIDTILKSSLRFDRWLKNAVHHEISYELLKKLFGYIIFPLNFILTIALTLLILPVLPVLDDKISILILVSYTIVLVLALVRYIRHKIVHNIYVFINLFGFGILGSISKTSTENPFLIGQIGQFWGIVAISMQILVIMLFMFFKDKLMPRGSTFSGIDLLLIIFMAFFYGLSIILQETNLSRYSSNAILVLFLYLSYRINMMMYDKIRMYLYFASFLILLVPLISTLV